MSQAGEIDVTATHPEIPTIFIADVNFAVPIANTLEILGGAGVVTTASGKTVTIDLVSAGFEWVVVTSAMNPITMVPETGYICKGAGSVHFILPAAAAIGDTFWIKGYGNLWTVAQNALQTISLGSSTTTAGIGGSIAATQVKDTIEFICVTANLEFDALDSVGNITFI